MFHLSVKLKEHGTQIHLCHDMLILIVSLVLFVYLSGRCVVYKNIQHDKPGKQKEESSSHWSRFVKVIRPPDKSA